MFRMSSPETGLGSDAAVMAELQARWPKWSIWRARKRVKVFVDGVEQDDLTEVPGDWVASRLDPSAGPERTVMRTTPGALDEALEQQAQAPKASM